MTDPGSSQPSRPRPRISMVVLNLNGTIWLERCFASLEQQTIFKEIEVIFADNGSSDGSAEYGREAMSRWENGVFVQHSENLGFCEGNNRAADSATGEFLMFINNDMWLEPDCLERLLNEVEKERADGATPVLEEYEDNNFQGVGATGFDIFGMSTASERPQQTIELFAIAGGSCLIRADLFRTVGGFDKGHFMYGEEPDLCWRVWIAGGRLLGVPSARIHHRTPARNTGAVTSERKRFLSTRNCMLMLMKNSRHFLLLLLIPNVLLRSAEAVASVVILRRLSFVRNVFLASLMDCWRMRKHVAGWRRHIKTFRKRGDFWILFRFLKAKPALWYDLKQLLRHGAPTVRRD